MRRRRIQLSGDDQLFVLTGAGISTESGLPTFRDSDGLWKGHDVLEVASVEGLKRNPRLVWDFYSMRRRDALAASPNDAHLSLARLEEELGDRFFLLTQNVDDLHERAGSRRIQHIHGNLFISRCMACGSTFSDTNSYDVTKTLPKCAKCRGAIRPDIVWFGESLGGMDSIYRQLEKATMFVAIGTSGSVFPAAELVYLAATRQVPTYYVGLESPENADGFDEIRLGRATSLVPALFAVT